MAEIKWNFRRKKSSCLGEAGQPPETTEWLPPGSSSSKVTGSVKGRPPAAWLCPSQRLPFPYRWDEVSQRLLSSTVTDQTWALHHREGLAGERQSPATRGPSCHSFHVILQSKGWPSQPPLPPNPSAAPPSSSELCGHTVHSPLTLDGEIISAEISES